MPGQPVNPQPQQQPDLSQMMPLSMQAPDPAQQQGPPPQVPNGAQQPDPSQQQPGQQGPPPGGPPQGQDPLDTVKQNLIQQYQDAAKPQGGRIKQLLGNFIGQMAGQSTPAQKQQRIIGDLNTVVTTQGTQQMHTAMAGMYGTTPITMPDGSTVSVLNKDVGTVTAAMARAQQGGVNAQVTAQAGIQKAQIGQGMLMPVTPEMAKSLGLPPGTTQIPLKQLNEAVGAATKPQQMVTGATDTYNVNKLTGDKSALGVGSARLAGQQAHPVQVAETDENGDPTGRLVYVPASQAMASGAMAPGSTPFVAQKAVIKSATSGSIGNTLNAFNTATDHLKILQNLGDALGNGNSPMINNLAQKYATATGSAAPTSFDMAKNAVAGEIAKTFKGNATEGEIASINETINKAMSPAQLKGAIGTALQLMGSKKAAIANQISQGSKGRPALDEAPQQTTGHKVGDVIVQGGRSFKATSVDRNGKVIAADPQ